MKGSIIIIILLIVFGCAKTTKKYEVRVLEHCIENKEKEWLENKLDNNVLYLFFLSGFKNDVIEIKYHDITFKEKSVITDQSLGLATVIVINKNADTNLKIRVSEGPELVFNPFEYESNKMGVYFKGDTLMCQPFRYAPTFE